ncbi:ribonuclease HI [Candidatus Pelagibacter sp. HIMB109]|jgi:ribonuclease HI|uniref:ribonuclease HI n=1 Tax=Candidatus Pelagibacter sp. HIMB109 TaxID=3415412 RepID=UPI003F848E62
MIKIYTDGACSGNPGRGGWAAIILNGEKIEKISGSKDNTTNNRMELTAVISALKYVKDKDLEIYTDSKYTKDGIEKWISNWKKNGWKTANKQDVKNKDLWNELDQLNSEKNVQWNWVKGHANNQYNNMADELARSEVEN